MLYEVGDIHEAMTIHNRRLILVSLFQQPREQMQSAHIWKPLDGTHHLNIHNEKPLDGAHLGHIDYSCSHPCKDSIIHYKDPHTFTARRKPLVTRMQKLIIIGCRNISCSTSKQCVEYTNNYHISASHSSLSPTPTSKNVQIIQDLYVHTNKLDVLIANHKF